MVDRFYKLHRHGTNENHLMNPHRAPTGDCDMYIVFLMSLISAVLILMGRRGMGVAATLVTIVIAAVMLYLDMTTKLQISL